MSDLYCDGCGEPISQDDSYWYGGDAYCETCFYDRFTYCSRCDEPVSRDYVRYDSNDDPICDDCWEEEIDYNAPDDPDITDPEREQIINLSKSWLKGEKPRTLIRINRNDYYLSEIQQGVGLVDTPIYLYGLQDRDEYQIKASPDILEIVREGISELEIDAIVFEDVGHKRLSVSKALREEQRDKIIELIKTICPSSFAGYVNVEETCAE